MAVPVVSVLIPTYNRSQLLREAIASALAQTFLDFEVIVIDDGSDDDSRAAVESFGSKQISYVRLEHCGNLSMLRNAGIRRAKGQLMAFLDSDDLWRADKLALETSLFETNQDAGFIVSGYEIFGAEGIERTKLYGKAEGATVRSLFDDLVRGKITLCSSSVLIRRSLINQAGFLNETLRTGDYEFYTRLAWHAPAGVIHAPLVRVRKHAGNSSLYFDAEGLQEAIFSISRFYSLGVIGSDIRNDRLLKYRYELAQILFRRGDAAAARREILACIRLRPSLLKAWRALGSFLLPLPAHR